MFNYEEFYKLYNCRAEAAYREARERLSEMIQAMIPAKERGFREKIFWYVKSQGEYLLQLLKLEEKWTSDYYRTASLAELRQDQEAVFGDIAEGAYGKSYANPAYAAQLFGKELGPVLAACAGIFREGAEDAYCHRRFMLEQVVSFFFDLQKKLQHSGQVRAEAVAQLVKEYMTQQMQRREELRFHKTYNVSAAGRMDRLMEEDLQQPYYLYEFGVPVSEQEESLQQFFAALPQTEIDQMARTFSEGYRKGFIRDNKDIRKKKTVALYYPMGMERVIRKAVEIFRSEMDLEPFVAQIESAGENRQYAYDHRFDEALYLDADVCQVYRSCITKLAEENEALLQGFGGPAVLESFGRKPFEPEIKDENLKLTAAQTEWKQEMNQWREQELYRVGHLSESSFTIMALPVPAIGEQFEEIFHEIVKINCGADDHLARAQQALIHALDRGTGVYVSGRGNNETDLYVQLQPLENPKRQTNFFNCLADVNIPAGEVFTSPQLKGTNGILHVEKAYLNGMCFENLKLNFTDGYITEYSCTNFEDPEKAKEYVYENLLHPHDTLPMGEFAIGTNTGAYCIAKRYDIIDILPVLIVEKLGPHFAIGDTCYAYEEDQPVFNPDRKEITARDNERSILRKTRPEEAYYQTHTDITLPIDAIGCMSVVKSSGDEFDLIREGRFVLIGTDILNAPIMAMENQLKGDMYVTGNL